MTNNIVKNLANYFLARDIADQLKYDRASFQELAFEGKYYGGTLGLLEKCSSWIPNVISATGLIGALTTRDSTSLLLIAASETLRNLSRKKAKSKLERRKELTSRVYEELGEAQRKEGIIKWYTNQKQ